MNTILQTTFPTPMFFFFFLNLAINVSPDQALRYAAPHQDRLCLYMYMSQLWVALLKRAKCTNFSNTEVLSNIVGPLARRCVMWRPVGVGIVCTCLCSTWWSPCFSRRDEQFHNKFFSALRFQQTMQAQTMHRSMRAQSGPALFE